MEFSDGAIVSYVYDAEGTKLRTTYSSPDGTVTTDYLCGLIFENDEPQLLLTPTGYLNLSDNKYRHYIHDHQGNIRVVKHQDGAVEETNDYYPFGGRLATSTSDIQPFKYSGKELETRHGLHWYDFGARCYDPVLARWTTPDPLSEKYYGISPYAFCNNNPVNFVDPDGEHPIVVGAVIGGAISGTSAIIKGKSFTEVLAATAGGAIDGAIATSGGKLAKIAKIWIGAIGGGVGDIVEQGLNVLLGNQEKIDLTGAGVSAAVGMLSTGVSESIESGLKSMAKSATDSQSTYEAVEKEVKARIKSTGRNPKPSEVNRFVESEVKTMDAATSSFVETSVQILDYTADFYTDIFIEDER